MDWSGSRESAAKGADQLYVEGEGTGFELRDLELRADDALLRRQHVEIGREALFVAQPGEPVRFLEISKCAARFRKPRSKLLLAGHGVRGLAQGLDHGRIVQGDGFVILPAAAAILTLERAATLIPELRTAIGDLPFELHGHCTTGVAPQVYVLAAQLGVDVLHTAIGALANGTSQPSVTRLVANLATLGIDVDVDLDAVAEAEALIARFAATQGLPPGRPTEYDLSFHAHQIPGGMMGTLRRQLDELRMPDALPALLEEVTVIRAELGYPIMVTPYSQFVGSQAMLNVVGARTGQARWSRLPDEVIRYVLGHFGTPPGEIAEVVRDAVRAAPRTRELDKPPPEPTIDEIRAQVAASLGRAVDDDEAVLRVVLPGDQLAAVERAGPAPAWTDSGDHAPAKSMTAADFVRAVETIPGWRRIDVSLGDEHVTLRRDDS